MPLMSGVKDAVSPHDIYCYYNSSSTRLAAVRKGKWKLHLPGISQVGKREPKRVHAELYDLSRDIKESKNIASKNAKVVKELIRLADEYDQELNANARKPGMTCSAFLMRMSGLMEPCRAPTACLVIPLSKNSSGPLPYKRRSKSPWTHHLRRFEHAAMLSAG